MDLASQIWQKNGALWTASKHDSSATRNGLGWLDLPANLPQLMRRTHGLMDELEVTGKTRVVLLGMGGSSMAVEALRDAFGIPKEHLRILDTLHPDTLASLDDLSDVVFVVASKSGTTRETLLLEEYFRSKLSSQNTGKVRFIALSDTSTALAVRGGNKKQFNTLEITPNDVGGRFSALSAFGIIPFGLAGGDLESLIQPIKQAVIQLKKSEHKHNEGLKLGQFFHEAILSNTNKITVLASPSLNGFSLWAEQLLAESTGKDGTGLIPVVGEDINSLSSAQSHRGRSVVIVRLETDDNRKLDACCEDLEKRGLKTFKFNLNSATEIGAQFLIWEFATAVTGSLMGINPFDQPDVEIAKKRAGKILEQNVPVLELPNPISAENLKKVIVGETGKSGGKINYIAVLAFLNIGDEMTNFIVRLRAEITKLTCLPTLFGYGPRYLHSTGQLLKGGPSEALVLGLWHRADKKKDATEGNFRLINIMNAQAQADFEILSEKGQKVVTLRVARDLETNVEAQLTLLNNLK